MTIARSRGVRQGGSMEPGMFCQALRLGIGQFKKEINGEGVAFEYMGIMPFGLSGVAANMFRTIAFHQRELLRDVIGIRYRNQPRQDRGICHRKGTSRRRIMVRSLQNIDVRIPRWRRKKVNGHWSPCRYSGKFLLEQEVAVDEDGSSGRLAHASVLCRTNKRRPSSPLNHSVRGNVTSKELWTRGCPSKNAVGQTTRRSGRTRNPWATGVAQAQSLFPERCPCSGLHYDLTSKQTQARISTGKGKVRIAIDGSEAYACLGCGQNLAEQERDAT